ncbi:MAG: oxidoreductase [Pseudomonadota bacterium]
MPAAPTPHHHPSGAAAPQRRLRLAVVGWGRLGQACAAAIHEAGDLALAGIVRRADAPAGVLPGWLREVACVSHVRDLGALDGVLLCVPAQAAAGAAEELLQARVPLVECAHFDEPAMLGRHHEQIAHHAERFRATAVVGAGWNAGVVPQLQRLFELLIPKGQSRTLDHVAAGLHHTAAAEGVPGVRGALSAEWPDAAGAMHRYVYVQLAEGADAERIRERITADPLYAGEPTEVLPLPDLPALAHESSGLLLERLASGAGGPHASLLLEARLDAHDFSARLMLDAARALPHQPHGGWRYSPFGLARIGAPLPANR